MIRVVSLFSVLAVACISVRADEPPRSATVKKLAQALGAATLEGDYAKVVDQTYDSMINVVGGREKAIQTIERMMKEAKAHGLSLKSYTVGEPGEFFTEGGNTFVVVPTTTEMALPSGRVVTKSYLLGISPDGGKTWKFADGSGLAKRKDKLDKLLPKLPAKLKLPESQKPEIIKDK